ncbi:hypothetical protein [Arthrobacter sp. ISL-30]|uniref:hypothetical protein n=1 Tax=Arthrobacter sp. ISL-30 TaxID=2819109 RepID=UPI001BEC1388|nr:hypothetical protein [Arthrobacter sp. ISL-30]MBT2512281.1 hypothetical protein [Arthrobacter sp. ISL-30]
MTSTDGLRAMEQEPGNLERLLLQDAFLMSGLTLQELWLACHNITGNATELELDGYLHGLTPLSSIETLILTHALNEHRYDQGLPPILH